ncbi:MAG: hypothetical protein U9R49_13510 [Bacteroidota bacterium]|nr:hypothetical protein [Bacteroidota bacterium]
MKITVALLAGVTLLLLGCEKNNKEPEYTAYTSIAAGTRFSLAVKTDGTLWAWGQNEYGQLGDGTKADAVDPKQIGAGFVSVAAGNDITLALKLDGTLWTSGRYYMPGT